MVQNLGPIEARLGALMSSIHELTIHVDCQWACSEQQAPNNYPSVNIKE